MSTSAYLVYLRHSVYATVIFFRLEVTYSNASILQIEANTAFKQISVCLFNRSRIIRGIPTSASFPQSKYRASRLTCMICPSVYYTQLLFRPCPDFRDVLFHHLTAVNRRSHGAIGFAPCFASLLGTVMFARRCAIRLTSSLRI